MAEDADIDEQLEAMRSSAGDFLTRCCFRSALQRNVETARLAKGHQRLLPFIYSRFHQMDQAQYILDPKQMRECAIELIPLLEDEERARSFQSDFEEGYYEGARSWMTACLYENLAESTGLTDGYNSDGMHQCIADGLQVCRRTGKLACIQCFREYATDVYTAADDSTMARHQCQTVLAHTGSWSDRGDRRWYVSTKLSWLNLLDGQIDAALAAAESAMELCREEDVSLKLESQLRAMVELDTVRILAGKERVDWSNPDPEGKADWLPPADEWPVLEVKRRLNDALALCCEDKPAEAVSILSDCDRLLSRNHCLTMWFDVRLRLIAAMRLAGQTDRIFRLAEQLTDRAQKASDFLTLRRLERVLNESVPVTPIAALAPLSTGPFATEQEQVDPATPAAPSSGDESTESETSEVDDDSADENTEYEEQVLEIVQRYFTSAEEAERDGALSDFLAIGTDQVTDVRHAGLLLHFARQLGGHGHRDQEIWAWAQPFPVKFPDAAGVVSLYAALGNVLRFGPDEDLQESIDGEEIEKLFRLAMSQNPDSVGAHLLAGEHFLFSENHGEAERCLARAFRLDRSNSIAALQLSEVYQQTDRPRDALNVLDLCLREGSDEPNVAWEALVQSVHTRQFEAALTYADRFDELRPDESGVNYYRGTALVELGRHEDALAAVTAERAHEQEETLHLDAVEACALLGAGRQDEARDLFARVTERSFADVTFLTIHGLGQTLDLLWRLSSELPDEDPVRQALRRRLLATGLMSDEFFDELRATGEIGRVNFYQVLVEQPLDESWADSAGSLPGQAHWGSYRIVWGVLAPDEDDAHERALYWQNQCETLPATVIDIATDGEGYRDIPGVVWQGMRWNDEEAGSEE